MIIASVRSLMLFAVFMGFLEDVLAVVAHVEFVAESCFEALH